MGYGVWGESGGRRERDGSGGVGSREGLAERAWSLPGARGRARPGRWRVHEPDPPPYGRNRRSASAESPAEPPEQPDDLSGLDDLAEQDILVELENRIVRIAAHAAALEHRLLVLIAEFDRREGWAVGGYRDCAEWLERYTGMNRVTARERVRMAGKLGELPRISDAMEHGELSYSKVRALVRVATPDNESELLPMASECTARELEREVAHYRELEQWGPDTERRRHAKRKLTVRTGPDGMVRISGRVPAEVGALLIKVLDAAGDALFRSDREWSPEAGHWGLATERVSADQRRADALRLVLDRAMVVGFEDVAPDEEPADSAPADSAESATDKPVDAGGQDTTNPKSGGPVETDREDPGSDDSPESPRRPCGCIPPSPSAERYTVLVHVDQDVLVHGDDGRCNVDGNPIPVETARRLSCDAAVVRIVHGPEGQVLDVGRKSRVPTPAIRRALWSRDGGCAFPGCGRRYVKSHHIRHWTDGGPTALENLVLLCPRHHHGVHDGGFSVKIGRHGLPRFFNRAGVRLPDQPPPAPRLQPDAVGRVRTTHRFRGIVPDEWTGVSPGVSAEARDRFQEALDPSEQAARSRAARAADPNRHDPSTPASDGSCGNGSSTRGGSERE